jgi:serine/threonine protein kinase
VNGLVRVFKEAKLTGDRITLYLQPVGTCGRMPVSIEEAKVAGKRVLTALQYLHMIGWVHRDVRPENVMFADQNWYLVDLEWANLADLPVGNYMPQEQWAPPEINNSDSSWTYSSDMWQFHKLLCHWNHLNEDGRRLLELLQCEDPKARVSADEALQHAYFS